MRLAGWVQLGGAACNVIVAKLWLTCGSVLVQFVKNSFGGVLRFGVGYASSSFATHMLFRLVWQDIWFVGSAFVQLGSRCVRCQCMWLTCVLQGVARVHLVQLWFSFGLYCGGLTVVGSVLVHEVI